MQWLNLRMHKLIVTALLATSPRRVQKCRTIHHDGPTKDQQQMVESLIIAIAMTVSLCAISWE